jgi:hypothetical protein
MRKKFSRVFRQVSRWSFPRVKAASQPAAGGRYRLLGDWTSSPADCLHKLAGGAACGFLCTFDDLARLGIPEEVLDWCKVSMVSQLLSHGEEMVVQQILQRLAEGRFGLDAWLLELINLDDSSLVAQATHQ